MIEREARVVACGDGRVTVEAPRQTACGDCSARSDCGTGVLAEFFGRRAMRLELASHEPVRVGERVVVTVGERDMLRAALLVYAMPLLALLLAAVLGGEIATAYGLDRDVAALAGAVAGFASGLALARRRLERLRPGHGARLQRHHAAGTTGGRETPESPPED